MLCKLVVCFGICRDVSRWSLGTMRIIIAHANHSFPFQKKRRGKTCFQGRKKERKKGNLLNFFWKKEKRSGEWMCLACYRSSFPMIHLVKGVFLLCFREVCGVVGSIVGCSLVSAISSSFSQIVFPPSTCARSAHYNPEKSFWLLFCILHFCDEELRILPSLW